MPNPYILQVLNEPVVTDHADDSLATWQVLSTVTGSSEAVYIWDEDAVITTADKNIYNTMPDLYDAYLADVARWLLNPNTAPESVVISCADKTGTQKTWGARTGNAAYVFGMSGEETKLQCTKSATVAPENSLAAATSVAIAPGVSINILGSLGSMNGALTRVKRLSIEGLNLYVQTGRTGALMPLTNADGSTQVALELKNASISNDDTTQDAITLSALALRLVLENATISQTQGRSVFNYLAAGNTLNVLMKGSSQMGRGTLGGTITASTSRLEDSTYFGEQPGATLPAGGSLFSKASSANVDRPTPFPTVVSSAQLTTQGATNQPIVRQGFAFSQIGAASAPNVGDTRVISDGTTTETFTYVAAVVNPFDVLRTAAGAGSTLANLVALAAAINTDSTLWSAALIQNPQTTNYGVLVYRTTQGGVEHYSDRGYGVDVAAVGTVIDFTNSGIIPLHYSNETFRTGATFVANPGRTVAGFGSPASVGDAQPVYVKDGLTEGMYMSMDAIGSGNGEWVYLCSPLDKLRIDTTGTTTLTRRERAVVVDLGAGETHTITLSTFVQPGELVYLKRVDTTATATCTLAASAGGTVDGGATKVINQNSGYVLLCVEDVTTPALRHYFTLSADENSYALLPDDGSPAVATLLFGTGALPTAGDTITIGTDVYEFQDSGGTLSAAGRLAVQRDAVGGVATVRVNLVAAINGNGVLAPVPILAFGGLTDAPVDGTMAVNATDDIANTRVIVRSATTVGGTTLSADPDLALTSTLTVVTDFWETGNVNMNTLAGRAAAMRRAMTTTLTVTAAMITATFVRIDTAWGTTPTAFVWQVRTAAGGIRYTANDTVVADANGFVITLAGGVAPDIQDTDILTIQAWE